MLQICHKNYQGLGWQQYNIAWLFWIEGSESKVLTNIIGRHLLIFLGLGVPFSIAVCTLCVTIYHPMIFYVSANACLWSNDSADVFSKVFDRKSVNFEILVEGNCIVLAHMFKLADFHKNCPRPAAGRLSTVFYGCGRPWLWSYGCGAARLWKIAAVQTSTINYVHTGNSSNT